jgi:hypothetical protein
MQYTFTAAELRQLLAETIKTVDGQPGVYDFSEGAQAKPFAIEATMYDLELSYDAMPLVDEAITWTPDDTKFEKLFYVKEPSTDNISPAELGLMEAM